MRRRVVIPAGVALVCLAVFAAYAVWAIRAGSTVGQGWRGLGSAWPYLLAGVLTVACAIGGFVWLAFFSERSGYDDNTDVHKP